MSIIDSILVFAGRHEALEGPLQVLNRDLVNHFAAGVPPRPRAFSLWSPNPNAKPSDPDYITDYTSWPGLTNKRFSARHLPPADPAYRASLPPELPYDYANPAARVGEATKLFARVGPMSPSRSSVLFMSFAQWFTDSILRINLADRRTNRSNHDIDLCSIYGLTEETTRTLRAGVDGKLRSQRRNGEELLDDLCEPNPDAAGATRGGGASSAFRVRDRYKDLEINMVGLDVILMGFPDARRERLYATGLERGNSSIGYVAISTIFMREHNRIATALKANNPSWGDERLFQTARNINIVILMKLVVEDYINHILGHHVFLLDPTFAEQQH